MQESVDRSEWKREHAHKTATRLYKLRREVTRAGTHPGLRATHSPDITDRRLPALRSERRDSARIEEGAYHPGG